MLKLSIPPVAETVDIGEKLLPPDVVCGPVFLPRQVGAAMVWDFPVRSSGGYQVGEAFEVLAGGGEEEFFGCS